MEIRPFRPEDLPELEQIILEAEGFGEPFLESTKTNILNTAKLDTAQTFVAVSPSGEVLGFCDCWIWHTGLEIEDLIVKKAARGQGVGRALVECAAAWAKERGCDSIIVGTPQAVQAIPFYLKLGFEFAGFTLNEDGKGTRCAYFWKEIKQAENQI